MKKLILWCALYLLPFSVAYAASPVILINPPPLYFSKPDQLKPAQIQKLIVDAVISSNAPEYVWTIVSKQPGLVTANLVVRNKHYADIDIHYDPVKLIISYKDSQNLKYAMIHGKYAVIHPNYLKWIRTFIISLENQAQVISGNVSLNATPSTSGRIHPGDQLMVMAAYGESSRLDDGNSLSDTDQRLSYALLQSMVNTVARGKPDKLDLLTLDDMKLTKAFINEGHDLSVAQGLCHQYKADKVFVLNSPVNLNGGGERYITYYLYLCHEGRMVKAKYTVDSGLYDGYSFQGDTQAALRDFIQYAKVYY